MNLPFRAVHTTQADDTHLVLNSPALPGHRPDRLAPQALCGEPAAGPASTAVADVQCLHCLMTAPAHLALPGFAGAA